MMKPRVFAGAIRRAARVFVRVVYNPDVDIFIQVPKTSARLILDEVRDTGSEVDAVERRDGLYIG